MKFRTTILLIVLLAVFYSCSKDEFDIDAPDVHTFVQQLKNGTYNEFYYNEAGEKVWALMPAFELDHVAELIELASDTSFLPEELKCVPLNPMSSRIPFPSNRPGKIILGEYLLWCAQYAIEGGFPSLDPFLVNNNEEEPGKGISAKEILEARNAYEIWWNQYGDTDINEETPHPLSGTPYRWF
ncbi:DUF4943 family protein [uncultured Draconibacterium sp.]|uniref:DUF4943 family protein n=1 Tax=uncultured Draconibacterium sp. TaxID=1573823 RepID=UPI0032165848